jgi:hypothetical protein
MNSEEKEKEYTHPSYVDENENIQVMLPTKIKPKIVNTISDKYDRSNKSDNILKSLTFLIIGMCGLIFFGAINQTTYRFDGILSIINYIFMFLFTILNFAWLYYKLQHIIIGGYKIFFMDLSIFKTNSKYYSGLEIPDIIVNHMEYPDITIQMPVYKESLENTIKPTIMSAITQAKRYALETGSICNIIVCDDGYNLLTEEEKDKRKSFYNKYGIGFTARPHSNKLKRVGRFKKAGNLNFSLNYSKIVTEVEYDNTSEPLVNDFNEMVALGAVFEGDLYYAPYIFLIDSDTRMPNFPGEENGCLKRMIKDYMFDGKDHVLYLQCFTGPYLSIKSLSEKCVFHFTCHIYNGILVATALNSTAPLVGHNAFLNFRLLSEISTINPKTNYRYYWAEDRISEDFDCMMRGNEKGYIGRYVANSGVFLEGISFNYLTEYFKVSKFACGAAELTFNPITKWFVKGGGILSSDIIGFVMSKEIEWYNKLSILSYILNFIAIAQAHVAMFYNLLFFEELFHVLPYVLLPINLMWEGMIVWGVINSIINILFSYRLNFDKSIILRQQFRELLFTSSLYGSLSVRFSIMYLTHLFNLNISFGATQKDDETVKLIDWITSTKYECIVYTFYLACIFIRIFFFTVKTYWHTFYFGCLPLLTSIFWYWFGPIVYDIIPSKKNKFNTNYISEEKMFMDKYNTQIPNTKIFLKKTYISE